MAFFKIIIETRMMVSAMFSSCLRLVGPALVLLLCCAAGTQAKVATVAAGSDHTLAVHVDGTVWGWGLDGQGQLGVGRLNQSNVPVPASGLPPIVKIAQGGRHSLALAADGSVWAWGENGSGQLGDGGSVNRALPVKVKGLSGVLAIAAGDIHSLALTADGTVWTWGRDVVVPEPVPGLGGVRGIATSFSHSLAVMNDGSVWAWGWNGNGQLGDGSTTSSYDTPVQVSGLSDMVAVGTGEGHSLAVTAAGTVYAWGSNEQGQLGDGSSTSHSTPVLIAGLAGVTSVAAGDGFSLALKADGSVWGWGANWYGEVGDGSSPGRLYRPTRVSSLSNVVAISAGVIHSLATKDDGSAWAWGYNSLGQLGDGSYLSRRLPVQVSGVGGVVAVAAGGHVSLLGGNSMALKSDGSVWAWGDNGSGQLADGSPVDRTTPIQVTGLAGTAGVAAGNSHSLALQGDGSVWSWGDNSFGMLGDGSFVNRSLPLPVKGLSAASGVAAGYHHSLALATDGSVWAWGDNQHGQLGVATVYPQSPSPVRVSALTDVVEVAAAGWHSLAIKRDGSVWTWGSDGVSYSATPVQVSGLSGVVAVATGLYHHLALQGDGSVWAWGTNGAGQLGDGTRFVDRSVPVKIISLTGVVALATSGQGHSLALKGDGTVWAWGDNWYGESGDAVLGNKLTPTRVAGLTGGIGVAAGERYSVVALADGTLASFGDNRHGQLGDSTFALRSKPVLVSNAAGNDALDLAPDIPNTIAPELHPPFWLQVSRGNEVKTSITYNSADLDRDGSVYVVAYLDAASFTALTGTVPAATFQSIGRSATSNLVSAVLTRSGWKQQSPSVPTEAVSTGLLGSANSTVTLFDTAKFDQTKGNGIFCVGYAGASSSSAKGLIRSVVTGTDAGLTDCPAVQLPPAPDVQAPTLPASLTALAAGPGQVNLSWSAATDNVAVAHYNVYRGGTLIATLGNVTSYSDTSPLASTGYSYSVMACDAALNCSGQSSAAQVSTPAQASLALAAGWNLVGNGGSTAMNVASLFGDAAKVTSIWKWVRSGSTQGVSYPTWAFYTPSIDGGAAYAASKGYDTLGTVQSGEGFWVNAKAAFSVPMTAPAWILSSVFQTGQSKALGTGWSLIATGEAHTASAFNKAIGATPPAAATVPVNLTSLWAWDNGSGRWYFYAPELEAIGTLQGFLGQKSYLDFAARGFTPATGFWVNKP